MSFSGNHKLYSDGQLITALVADDRAAFAELYDRYWQMLYQLARQKLRGSEIAEEVVQELFVSLRTKRQTAVIREVAFLFVHRTSLLNNQLYRTR